MRTTKSDKRAGIQCMKASEVRRGDTVLTTNPSHHNFAIVMVKVDRIVEPSDDCLCRQFLDDSHNTHAPAFPDDYVAVLR